MELPHKAYWNHCPKLHRWRLTTRKLLRQLSSRVGTIKTLQQNFLPSKISVNKRLTRCSDNSRIYGFPSGTSTLIQKSPVASVSKAHCQEASSTAAIQYKDNSNSPAESLFKDCKFRPMKLLSPMVSIHHRFQNNSIFTF
jgi:hypothetical protein